MNKIAGDVFVDDRGSVRFVNGFDFKAVKRFYQVENHELGFVRAWHGHLKEAKYIYVARGAALIGAVKLLYEAQTQSYREAEPPQKWVISDTKPAVLYIPEGYANGFMNLTADTIIQFFSTASLEDSRGDDIRFPYNQWDIWQIEKR